MRSHGHLVGDEAGHIYLYSVEWPDQINVDIFAWPGSLTVLARLDLHTQQICGLAWSFDGRFFASGGNDNVAPRPGPGGGVALGPRRSSSARPSGRGA